MKRRYLAMLLAACLTVGSVLSEGAVQTAMAAEVKNVQEELDGFSEENETSEAYETLGEVSLQRSEDMSEESTEGNWGEALEETLPTGLLEGECIELDGISEDEILDINSLAELPSLYSNVYNDEWDKYSTNYYYNQLNSQEKALWDALDWVCLNYLTGTQNTQVYTYADSGEKAYYTQMVSCQELDVPKAEVLKLARMFRLSNPQYYFLNTTTWSTKSAADTTKISSIGLGVYTDFQNGLERQQKTEEFKQQITALLAQVTGSTEEEKAKELHDVVVKNVDYNYDILDGSSNIIPGAEDKAKSQSAYSMICMDLTVCAGYAMGFELLSNALDLDSVCVTSANHQWNKVRINDSWYNVDCTWDDQEKNGYIYYQFFERSDAAYQTLQQAASHVEEDFWAEYRPVCSLDSNPSYGIDEPGTLPEITETTAAPVIELVSNGDSKELRLTSATAGADIYYTLDGGTPTPAATRSIKYRGAIAADEADCIKAAAVHDGFWDSAVVEGRLVELSFDANGAPEGGMDRLVFMTGGALTLPENAFVKKGFHFNGWNTKADGSGTAYADGETVDTGVWQDNVELYAQWERNRYSIVYDGNGATAGTMPEQMVEYDSGVQLSANVYEKTGSEFLCWNTRADGTGVSYADQSECSELTEVNGAVITLYAQWGSKKYTITYHLSGGENSVRNPEIYYLESKDIVLEAPTRTGYTFAGWYSDEAYTEEVTEIATGSTGDKDFYAKWKANQFKIIYDGNGATGGEVIEQVISYGKEAWMNQNGFERPGYRFVEWNRMPDGTGEAYADKSECSTLTTDNDVIILLFAQWEKVPYTITYYLNGGTNSSKNPTKYDVESEEIVLENPTRTGYSFKGWYSDETCTEEITGIAAGSIGDKNFYAKWEKDAEAPSDKPDGAPDNQPGGNTDGTADKTPGGTADEKTYEIRYKLNGGTNHRGNPRTYQSTSAVSLQKPTRKGYTFAGWYIDEKFKSKVTQIKKGSTGTKTLYAKWTPNQYRILYQANGGKGKKITPQTKLKYGSSYLLKKNSLKRDGYKFAGWNTKKNGKGKTYKDKAKVKNLVEKANGSITLYAQWKPITYKITYKLNGGKNNRQNPKKYDVTTNVKLKEPTRKGYKFKGWYTSASYKKKVTKLKKGSIGNQKLYAKWVKLK